MKDKTLCTIIAKTSLSNGTLISNKDNYKIYLFENKLVVEKMYDSKTAKHVRLYNKHTFAIFLVDDMRVGGILKCGSADLHFYMFQKSRYKDIFSRIIKDGFIKKYWDDVKSISCCGHEPEDKIKHFAKMLQIGYREKYWSEKFIPWENL